MKLYLKRFSQEVSLSDPDKVLYFMVFEIEGSNKGEIKLPVPKETNEALIRELYAEEAKTAAPEPDPLQEADIWEPEEVSSPPGQQMYYVQEDVSEDEVPSV